jgi:hypothetical protein
LGHLGGISPVADDFTFLQTCVRSIASGYGLCSLFVPGDRHVVLGTKKGSLQIFDLGSASMTEEVDAHAKEIWCRSYQT